MMKAPHYSQHHQKYFKIKSHVEPPVISRRHGLLSMLPLIATDLISSQVALAGEYNDETRQLYDKSAREYDKLDGGLAASALGFDAMRAKLISQARGSVLEIGVGTGLNLPYYDFKSISDLVGVDLSTGMLREAQRRAESLGPRSIKLIQADATALPLAYGSFDSVLDTFSLCVFSDPLLALKEMKRVLRPGGHVLLLEHSRSDNQFLAGYQGLTAEAVRASAKGCDWNQDVPRLVEEAGLSIVRIDRALGGTIVSIEAKAVK